MATSSAIVVDPSLELRSMQGCPNLSQPRNSMSTMTSTPLAPESVALGCSPTSNKSFLTSQSTGLQSDYSREFTVAPTVPSGSPRLLLTPKSYGGGPITVQSPCRRKRVLLSQYSLLPDGCEEYESQEMPAKKPKRMLTTSISDRPHDVAVYFTERMLELSRISRRTIFMKMEYQRLRAAELELMGSIIHDELEESDRHLLAVDLQMGTFLNQLHDAGVANITTKGRKYAKESGNIRMFPSRGDQDLEVDDSDSSDFSSDLVSTSICSGCVEDGGAPLESEVA